MKMTTQTAQDIANNAIKWIDGLSTTTVRQGFEKLGDAEVGFCCLGYGCVLMGVDYQPDDEFSEEFADRVGLRESDGTAYDAGDIMMLDEYYSLAEMNDGGRSFKEISDEIKNNLMYLFHPPVAERLREHYSRT
jgi:hypothetical protein